MPVSLHTHSWYSFLEGASSLDVLLQRASGLGYSSFALTDTNNLYGSFPFSKSINEYGIRPIFGACLKQQKTRCVALVAEKTGYQSLCRIITRLYLGGNLPEFPAESLADLLRTNAEGLHVLVDDLALARQLKEAYGQRVWLEVVRPGPYGNASDLPSRQEAELLAGARGMGLRPVASTAAHFATPTDYHTFRLITAARQGGLLDQLPRQLAITPDHHLVSPREFQRRFRDLPEAVRNTDLLAEQLRPDVLPRETIMPSCHIPEGMEGNGYLQVLCEQGLVRREMDQDPKARQRLQEELAVIAAGNLATYFLVVRDITRYARQHKFTMALRGSAGSSLVCYLLEITDVDPLRFGMSLERFLHLGRPDLPDIDLDFDWKVRDELIDQVMKRYGPRHTAMISSHLFLQPRSAFREAGKLHGLSNEQISTLVTTLSERVESIVTPLSSSGEKSGSSNGNLKLPPGFPLESERWPRIVRDARLLLGRPHHLSVHPGGIVITPRPIENYVPVQLAAKGITITQLDKDGAEAIGLVKIDLLGNRALAAVDEAVRHVGPLLPRKTEAAIRKGGNDAATLDLIRRGETLGVTQIESPAMRHLLIQLRPDQVEEVIQALALVRPGVGSIGMKDTFLKRRRGLEPVPKVHPRLDALLAETQGMMLYEDDALQVIQAMTRLSVPEAYRLYKRISKQQTEPPEKLLGEFVRLCAKEGIPEQAAAVQWMQLSKFRQYTFCKSHSVSYGLIAWLGAYLKAHYPLQFWTAVLNNTQGSYPQRVYVEALKRAGIALRLPCVNRSTDVFRIEGDGIRVGLGSIATLPDEFREKILAERERNGPFRDLGDFRKRVQPGPEGLTTLIRCGAFDFTGRNRPALHLETELQERHLNQQVHGQERTGDLFPSWLSCSLEEWSPKDYTNQQRWRDEWKLLGFVVGPPLMSLFRPHLPKDLNTSRDLANNVGKVIRVAGVVATYRNTSTSDGRDMQFLSLEDEWGLIEINLFPGCPLLSHLELGPYLAEGIVNNHLDVLTINATRVEKAGIG